MTISQVTEAAWERDLARCPDATYFHTLAWQRIMQACYQVEPRRLRFSWSDGRWALLPLSIWPLARGWVPLAQSGDLGAYGGLVTPFALAAAEVDDVYRAVRREHGSLQLTGNPLAAGPHLPAEASGREDTHLLALKPLPELRQGFSRGCKARGNKARKQGLRVEIHAEPAAAASFYPIYLDSVTRWGEKLTFTRPAGYYEGLLRHGAKLFLAYAGEEAVSGLLFVSHGRATHYLSGATRAEHLASCPSNLLMEEALAHFHAEGRQLFDFGASGGLAGVSQFKESFGARAVSFGKHAYSTPRGRLYFVLRGALERWRAA